MHGEIYSAANDREQAGQVFKVARQIVEADPELRALVDVVPSTKRLVCKANGSFYAALSAEAGTKHGLNPSMAIFDELAQAKNRELYDTLDTAMGAREEPLFVVISTQSPDPEHPLSQLIDDGLSGADPTTLVHLYAADEEADVLDEAAWAAANPALGDFRDLEDLKAQAERASRMPGFENTFRNLCLNQRVSQVAGLISPSSWTACGGEAEFEDGEAVYLGLDLSETTDLTALVMVSAENGERIRPFFWKPQALLDEHARRDRVPYVEWAKAGLLDATPGPIISRVAVAQRVAELSGRYRILGMAYDRWKIETLLVEMDRIGLRSYSDKDGKKDGDGLRIVPWGQGFGSMAPAVNAFEEAVLRKSLIHDGNPLLRFCVRNAIVTTDPSGNRKLDKGKARQRIDGAVALAMALELKARERAPEAPKASVYKSRGLRRL